MFSRKTIKMFEAKYEVNQQTGCWDWVASRTRGGYGQFNTPVKDGRVWYRAHRFSYLAHKGPIPEGHVVMHKCDNPGCVNPSHLTTGPQAENIADRDAKGRGSWSYNAEQNRELERLLKSAKTDAEIARELGCSRAHVWKARNGRYAWQKDRAEQSRD